MKIKSSGESTPEERLLWAIFGSDFTDNEVAEQVGVNFGEFSTAENVILDSLPEEDANL